MKPVLEHQQQSMTPTVILIMRTSTRTLDRGCLVRKAFINAIFAEMSTHSSRLRLTNAVCIFAQLFGTAPNMTKFVRLIPK